MQTQAGGADLTLVGDTRGQRIQQRLDDLGISDREFAARSGVDRKTLRRAVADDPAMRGNTYRVIEDALADMEALVRGLPDEDSVDDLVEFRLSGEGGVDVVVKGPMRDRAELEESVARLIREMRRTDNQD